MIAPTDNAPTGSPGLNAAPMLIVFGVLCAGAVAVACPQFLQQLETQEEREAHAEVMLAQARAAESACEIRGAAYFRKIGAASRFPDGRDAATVIRERCERSARSFR